MPSELPSPPVTPMMRQYLEIKEKHRDAILLYRIGDFYEMFYDDAVVASKILEIALTSRNKNDERPIPLCGVPYHAVQPYITRLLSKGLKVAICDQVEDPKTAQGVIRREVTRLITPGLITEEEGLGAKELNYLAAVVSSPQGWGLAFLELSTGDFRIAELSPESLREELEAIGPKEILLPERMREVESTSPLFKGYFLQYLPDWVFEPTQARERVCRHFQVASLAGFECETVPWAVAAAGAVLHYLQETQKRDRFPHLTAVKRWNRGETMVLTREVQETLDLPRLFDFIDRTCTTIGSRHLKDWLGRPLLDREALQGRLDTVEELARRKDLTHKIRDRLDRITDIERIAARISLETADARDLVSLARSLEVSGSLEPLLGEAHSDLLRRLAAGWDSGPSLRTLIAQQLVDDPPAGLKEGGLFREGFSADLDGLRTISRDAKGCLAKMEEEERGRTGIPSLKIRFNRVFGYTIEVTTPHLSKVPSDFIRKQTTSTGERFLTPELKEFEDKILGAEEKSRAMEYELFLELRGKVRESVGGLKEQAVRIAELDILAALAEVASQEGYTRPEILEEPILEIRGARHPVVEKALPAGHFIANDLTLDTDSNRLLVLTGPNMAGKSTLIRQAGLLVVLAQIGSFVPAESARIGLVDRIFTRVGASDRLAEGQSTFMVEMSETAAILHYATRRSLILLDEIGRGTSTFDGISIAWAVAEYLHDTVTARTLFATHYHELTELEKTRPGIRNFNVAVREEGKEVIFLYKLVRGGMNASYGLHVARLAGIPAPVLDRAREVLQNLEQGEWEEGAPRIARRKTKRNDSQQNLF